MREILLFLIETLLFFIVAVVFLAATCFFFRRFVMKNIRWYINLDSYPAGASSVNFELFLPPIETNQAYRALYWQTGMSSLNTGGGEILDNRIERCQVLLDTDDYALGDRRMIVDCRDDLCGVSNGYRFTRNGIWAQEIWRLDPWVVLRLVCRLRYYKSSALYYLRVTHNMFFDVVPITNYQAVMLREFDIYQE